VLVARGRLKEGDGVDRTRVGQAIAAVYS
jgi:hypothetical protein